MSTATVTALSTRAERVAEAQRLRAQGLLLREIAERMGAPVSTVDNWVNDPDRAKQRARFARYGGQCPKCGAPRDGRHGLNISEDAWCKQCRASEPHSIERASRTAAKLRGRVKWTDEQILDALRGFYARHGAFSRATYDRFRGARRPSGSLVVCRFGTWNAAMEAAGLPTNPGAYDYERVGRDGCVLALQMVADIVGGLPTYHGYERVRRECRDLGLPSSALIRLRFGTWVDALRAAFEQVAA